MIPSLRGVVPASIDPLMRVDRGVPVFRSTGPVSFWDPRSSDPVAVVSRDGLEAPRVWPNLRFAGTRVVSYMRFAKHAFFSYTRFSETCVAMHALPMHAFFQMRVLVFCV